MENFYESYDFMELLDNSDFVEGFAENILDEIKLGLIQLKLYPSSSMEFKWILSQLIATLRTMRFFVEELIQNVNQSMLDDDYGQVKFEKFEDLIDHLINMIFDAERLIRENENLFDALQILVQIEEIFNKNFNEETVIDAE